VVVVLWGGCGNQVYVREHIGWVMEWGIGCEGAGIGIGVVRHEGAWGGGCWAIIGSSEWL
jgi:hypothetical protein